MLRLENQCLSTFGATGLLNGSLHPMKAKQQEEEEKKIKEAVKGALSGRPIPNTPQRRRWRPEGGG